MYTDNRSVQIVISLLKQYRVRHAVLSAGTRNVPVVHSLEQDPYFRCFSVVDERSAAYFALGLALETGEPVLLSCTSGTAAVNYTSAMWEARRQCLPLVALTSDRNQYYLGQLEDQMIAQSGMYGDACLKSVTLPIVESEKDAWYCNRLVNEALLELDHRGGGPVHINLPTEWGLFAQNFNTESLPKTRRIRRINQSSMTEQKTAPVDALNEKERVLLIFGQSRPVTQELVGEVSRFSANFGCVIAAESLSNLPCDEAINTNLVCRALTKDLFVNYTPDLVISVGGDYVSVLKGLLKASEANFDHWAVNQHGYVVDQFRRLTSIFECSLLSFFQYFNQFGKGTKKKAYQALWRQAVEQLPAPEFPYGSASVMEQFMEMVPTDSVVHYGNGVAVHMAQYFDRKDLEHYCHSGTTTIDGSLSSFIGQASVCRKLCFAFIGDLSFFYDMNALWNRHVGGNVRILLYNNEGGQTFHWNAAKDIETLRLHISAEHHATAKGWVESLGMRYYSAKNQTELDAVLPVFMAKEGNEPIVLEVFTDKEQDSKILHQYYEICRVNLESFSAASRGHP